MSSEIEQILDPLDVLEAAGSHGLFVFGLMRSSTRVGRYMTLDEALGTGKFEVAEVDEQGHVPMLVVRNRLVERVFIMVGEELVGAKQNRILNTSVMIPDRAEVPVPVSCVEQGRWHYSSPTFGSSGSSAHSTLRAAMTLQTSSGYRRTGWASSDQRSIWKRVRQKLANMGSRSTSESLHQVYEDHETRLKDIIHDLPAPDNCCGAVFTIGDRIAGADIFDNPITLRKLWPKILRSYAIDALESGTSYGRRTDRQIISEWLRAAQELREEPYRSTGHGWDIRLSSPTMVGASLVVDGCPVHVELFPL